MRSPVLSGPSRDAIEDNRSRHEALLRSSDRSTAYGEMAARIQLPPLRLTSDLPRADYFPYAHLRHSSPYDSHRIDDRGEQGAWNRNRYQNVAAPFSNHNTLAATRPREPGSCVPYVNDNQGNSARWAQYAHHEQPQESVSPPPSLPAHHMFSSMPTRFCSPMDEYYARDVYHSRTTGSSPSQFPHASQPPFDHYSHVAVPPLSGTNHANSTSPTNNRMPIDIPRNITCAPIQREETEIHLKLRIHDQPIHARSCGDSKDKRSIDPMPILQLQVYDGQNRDLSSDRFCFDGYFVKVSLFDRDGKESMMQVPKTYPPACNLVGNFWSTGMMAKDLEDRQGCFYYFPGLACRLPGKYRLHFSLLRVVRVVPGDTCPVLVDTFSEPFDAVPAKEFRGRLQQSPLAIHLKMQGAQIPSSKVNGRMSHMRRPAGPYERDED